MPLHRYNVRAMRIKLFTRTKQSPSSNTFINNNTNNSIKSDLSSSIVKSETMLHSKSTYFYHGGIGSKFSYIIPSVCGLAFLVGLGAAINPISNTANQASALSTYSYDGPSSISMTLDPSTPNNITIPANVGEVAYRENKFNVSVTNSNWYAVFIRAANGYDSKLRNTSNNSSTLSGVGENVPTDSFKDNTWGYALTDNTNAEGKDLLYSTIPETAEGSPAQVFGAPTSTTGQTDKSFKAVFAVKFGGDSPSGHYTSQVYLSAVTEPATIAENDFGVTTMQELGANPDICKDAEEHTTAQLIDERDGKIYWVTRMKDGNCWMTQNLDFDVPAELDNKTDISGASLITDTTRVNDIKDWSSRADTYNVYYDPGDYYYDGPNNSHAYSTRCDVNGNDSNVANRTLTKCNQFSTTSSDKHYHVGNYYSWVAATVKSSNTLSGNAKDTQYSICPAGWKLPTSDNQNKNSFYDLLSKYGLQSKVTNGGSYSIYGSPIYFVYGGYLTDAHLYEAGASARYYSSTLYSDGSNNVYHLYITSGVTPSGGAARYFGVPVRCLVVAD